MQREENFFEQVWTPREPKLGEPPQRANGIDDQGYWDALDKAANDDGEPNAEPSPQPATGEGFPLTWFRDIEPIPDVRDFVQGLLIEQASAVVYGRSNSGKTFFVTDLALHVAAGLPWRGRRAEQGGVVYCVLEGGAGFRNRVAAWKEAHGLGSCDQPFAAIQSSIRLLEPEADTDKLIASIRDAAGQISVPVKMVVIDTLSRAMAGGNENAAEDMGALVAAMDRIRAQTGAMVLFVHHSGKDEAKGSRGHSSLQAAIDTEIEVVDSELGEPSVRSATVVKQRELPKGDYFEFTLKAVEIGRNRHDEPVTTCLVECSTEGASTPAAKALRHISGHSRRALEVLTDLMAASGASGFKGVPTGMASVPEDWWREQFYSRAMPAADQDTKKKAFRRAADGLIEGHIVGLNMGRVWIVQRAADE
jgi:hypothetical protein